FLVALATLNLISEVADDKPIVVLADDVQWFDRPTASVLSFFARRLESTHILLVIGLREGFQSPVRSANVPEICVGPLSDGASRELLDAITPDLSHQARLRILGEAL